MSINQPAQPVEYEPIVVDQKDSLLDRFLIGVGDFVIRNFTFLVFITIVWGLVTMIFFGGIVLVYTVSERFREIEEREQQRQILVEQQLEQVVLSAPTKIQETSKWNDTAWFGALNETVELATNDETFGDLGAGDGAFANGSHLEPALKNQPATLKHQIIVDDDVWQINCGDTGFVYNDSYPCPIINASLLDQDPAVSN